MQLVLVAAEDGRISLRDFRINSRTGNVQNETPGIPKLLPIKYKRPWRSTEALGSILRM